MQLWSSTLVLPLAPPGHGPWSPEFGNEKKHDFQDGGKLRILVVDDEVTIADTLRQILSAEGYEVATASTGDAAIATAREFRPHMLLSDVVIPGPNGAEVAIAIREMLPECRIVLFSGQMETVDLLSDARKRGHEFEIVAKPIKPRSLLALIRNQPS